VPEPHRFAPCGFFFRAFAFDAAPDRAGSAFERDKQRRRKNRLIFGAGAWVRALLKLTISCKSNADCENSMNAARGRISCPPNIIQRI
jgi:hypothetical protein